MSFYIKPGEVLSWSVHDDSGDLSGTTIEAAVSAAEFYYPLTVTAINLATGDYELSAANTTHFPEGTLACDIKYEVSGIVTYTETFYVDVLEKVTA